MKTIIFIGTQKSGSSREAIKAAAKIGYLTVLLTDRKNFLSNRTEFPDVHLMRLCDLTNLEEIRRHIKQILLRSLTISAIVSFVDPHCYTASLLAEEYNMNHFSTNAIGIIQDKLLSRKILTSTPYNIKFRSITHNTSISSSEIDAHLPLIMKSPYSEGSKDVYKINNLQEFNQYKTKLLRKYPQVPILIEEFIDGPQYLVESIVVRENVQIVAVIRQEIILVNNHYIITGYQLLIDLPMDFYKDLYNAVQTIIQSHGMESGSCHLEMRYFHDNWKLIEINPRISGAGMNKLIEIGLGVNLVEETLKLALGQEPDVKPKHKKHAFAHYVVLSESGILENVTGRNRALRSPGVEHVFIKPRKGSLLTPPVSMGNRYAYVIASGSNEKEAEVNAKLAASKINFHLTALTSKKEQQILDKSLDDQTDIYLP